MVASRPTIVLQDVFLNQVRKEKTKVVVTFMDGETISGYVKGFDLYAIILESDKRQLMLYKHSVSRIMPEIPVNFTPDRQRQV
ncbi:MAG: RNA chaperone Hfq [Christensenellales bacterium]|jgi:host factor-I protein